MNLAVLFAKDTPNKDGIPAEWPVECIELGKSTKLPNDGRNWRLMTYEELKSQQELYWEDKEIWNEESKVKRIVFEEEYSKAIIGKEKTGITNIDLDGIVKSKVEIYLAEVRVQKEIDNIEALDAPKEADKGGLEDSVDIKI